MIRNKVFAVATPLLVLGLCGWLVAGDSAGRSDPRPAIDNLVLQRLDRMEGQLSNDVPPSRLRRVLVAEPHVRWARVLAATTQPTTQPFETAYVLVKPKELVNWQNADVAAGTEYVFAPNAVAATTQPTTQPFETQLLVYPTADLEINTDNVAFSPDRQELLITNLVNEENFPYLGVGVEAPGETLRAQLGLRSSEGLVVNYVDENGPSKGVIQKHDVLQKLDDQILINAEQLIALVRMQEPGKTVSVTLLRQAKPITVQIKIAQKQQPQKVSEQLNTWLDLQAADARLATREVTLDDARVKLDRAAAGDTDTRPITFNDGQILACLDGHGNLLAVDVKTGKTVFHGPIGTEEQWKAVPTDLRERLESWRKLIAPK